MLKKLIQRTPPWVIIILGIILLIVGSEFVGSDDATVNFLEDGTCLIHHNENFAFGDTQHIKWSRAGWVEVDSGDPVDMLAIHKYGEITMKTRMEGFQIAKDKPYVFVSSLTSTGKVWIKRTFFLRDNKWRATDSESRSSQPYNDYMYERFGDPSDF